MHGLAISSGRSVPLSGASRGERDQFAPDELAVVLSHYDLGVIDTIQEFPRGSRRAPKLLIKTEKGVFLLKRRARGKDDPFKVALCHQIQHHLAAKQFPMPHLIAHKQDQSMLKLSNAIYEVFEYIRGTGYDNSLEATQDAGKTLALFHKLAADIEPDYDPPVGSYHNARAVQNSMELVPTSLQQFDPREKDQTKAMQQTNAFLREAYNTAAAAANQKHLNEWPKQITHADWHPGNMLFRGNRVVAVIDYDAARLQQRIIDTANGALQFSITGGGDDAASWPDYLDMSRFKRFLVGYDSVIQISRAELQALPELMIEALIAEATIPIAATGSFARMGSYGFLHMVERKVRWMQSRAKELADVLG